MPPGAHAAGAGLLGLRREEGWALMDCYYCGHPITDGYRLIRDEWGDDRPAHIDAPHCEHCPECQREKEQREK